jgi:hypothetical protein
MTRAWFREFGLLLGLLPGCCGLGPRNTEAERAAHRRLVTSEKRRGDWGHDLGDPVASRVTTAQTECRQHRGTWSREPCAERDQALAESLLQRGPNVLRRHLMFTKPAVATHERFCAKIKGCTLRRDRLPLGLWTSPPLPWATAPSSPHSPLVSTSTTVGSRRPPPQ